MAILRQLRLNDELRIEGISIFVRKIAQQGRSVNLVVECPEDIAIVHVPYGASRWEGTCQCGEQVEFEGDPGSCFTRPCVRCDREIRLFPRKSGSQGGGK